MTGQLFNLYRTVAISAIFQFLICFYLFTTTHIANPAWLQVFVVGCTLTGFLGLFGWQKFRGPATQRLRPLLFQLLATLPSLLLIALWLQIAQDMIVKINATTPFLPILVLVTGIIIAFMALLYWLPGYLAAVLLSFAWALSSISEPVGLLVILITLGIIAFFGIPLSLSLNNYQRFLDGSQHMSLALCKKTLAETEAKVNEERSHVREVRRQLMESHQLSEQADRAKTEFLATISHEIRTPLNGIMPILDILGETKLSSEQKQYVSTAGNSAQHLMRIINDILDYAKAESGKMELESIEINLNELVDSVISLLAKSAEKRDLKLIADFTEDVPGYVRGDPIRLRQILINLVSNGIKFTETGGVKVTISKRRVSRKEIELLFVVTDTGIGMDEETTDRLFHSFTQADASTTRKHGGTGMGLVICKRLVELMGGKIDVSSQPGEGSSFWFLLPMRRSVRDVPVSRKSLNRVRVLSFVENPKEAEEISAYFKNWGMVEETVSTLNDVPEKLKAATVLGPSWAHDLLLLNVTAMQQGIPAILRRFASQPQLGDLQILVLTRSETLVKALTSFSQVYIGRSPASRLDLQRYLYRLMDVEGGEVTEIDRRRSDSVTHLTVDAIDVLDSNHLLEDTEVPEHFSGKVLLVEDNPVNLGVTRKLVRLLGLQCDIAEDGKVALDKMRDQEFDLVLMDCQMPIMDGYEATAEIRAREQRHNKPRMPIIAITANAMAGDREQCLASGMDDYLSKPIRMYQLKMLLNKWLNENQLLETEAMTTSEPEKTDQKKQRLLDQQILDELKEYMEDEFADIIETFLSNAPKLAEKILNAAADKQLDGMTTAAHSLKSSSANVGASKLSDLAKNIEYASRENHLNLAMKQVDTLSSTMHETAMALKNLLKNA